MSRRLFGVPDIFLSYKREDAGAAARLVAGLRDAGLDVWWDEDIPADAAWEATIERALTGAAVVLVCWSRAAVASDNVRSEARWAREQGRLVQLFVEPCNPPLFFGERQGIDISRWSGDGADPRFQRLVSHVRSRLAGDPAAAGPDAVLPAGDPRPAPVTALAAWLAALELDRYAAAFEAADVDLGTLAGLDDADLKEIGIPLGPRRRILAALAVPPAAIVARPASAPEPVEVRRASVAERRQITVMSVDLADSARLSAEVDPEDLAELTARYKESVGRDVAAAGGWLARSAGDGILAYFGWPQAFEDAAERAVQSGLDIAAGIGRLHGPDGRPLGCRVGLATGLVVVGAEAEGAAREVSMTGEALHLAAGLRRQAAPATVVMSEATHRQVGQLFDCEALAEQPIVGFSAPVVAWRALRRIPHLSRFSAARAVRTPFVGRAHELSLLADRWRTASEGTGRAVVVVAEAGMGKSRLADALNKQIDEPHGFITWQCSAYHQTKAFYPVVEYVTHAAGIVDDDDAAERLRKLTSLLAASGMPLDDSLALFAQLLAIPPAAGTAPPALPPDRVRSATIAALTEWMRRIAAARPLLLLIEDAHWIDATTLELLTPLIGSTGDVSVLTVITARPEFVSPWSGRAEVSTLGLDRLNRLDCELLARDVAGDAALQDRTVAAILSRSDGNPLFVEELSVAASEARTPEGAVPDSLQSSLMARLDRLGDVRQTAQICSVLGRRFARPLLTKVADIAPDLLDANLALLVEQDVIRPIGGGGEGRFEFKHALVRDAAYESMLLSQRRRMHAACGRALEHSFPDVARTEPELLAHHFELAGAMDEASAYAEQAGDRATAACAFNEAIASYESALRHTARLPEDRARDRRTLGLLLKLGPAIGMIRGGQDPQLGDIYRRAEALGERTNDTDAMFKAVWGLWYNANISRDLDNANTFAERLVAIGARSGEEDLALEALHCRWSSAWFSGDYCRSIADGERGLALYDRHRHHQLGLVFGGHDPGVCAHGCMGQSLVLTGEVERGFASVKDAIALGEALDHPASLAHGLNMGLVTSTVLRLPEQLSSYAERMLAVARQFNLPPQQATAAYHLAWVQTETGDRAAGLKEMGRLYDQVTATGPIVTQYKAMYVDQLLRAGDARAAFAVADRAIADLRVPDRGLMLSELLRLRGDCHAALGSGAEAVADLQRAEAMARRDGAGLLRLRAAGSLCREAGAQFRPVLEAALVAMPNGWDGPDVVEARRLLDA